MSDGVAGLRDALGERYTIEGVRWSLMASIRWGGIPLGLRFLRRFRLARTVEGDRLTNERLEGGRVNFFSFVDVDRRAFPSRLELKRRAGSFRDARLVKVTFTTFALQSSPDHL